MWSSLNNCRDGGLLFLRVALGLFYIWIHGWGRLAGGVATWKKLGTPMKHIGIGFLPEVWGFIAACASTIGVVFLIIGFVFRPSALVIFITLTVAVIAGIAGSTIGKTSDIIEMAILVLGLLFIGPGRYSFGKG